MKRKLKVPKKMKKQENIMSKEKFRESIEKKETEEGENKLCEISSDPKLREEIQRKVKERVRDYVEWIEKSETEFEKLQEISNSKVFSRVLNKKIRKSVAGQFLSEFNPRKVSQEEQESKLFLAKKIPTCQWKNDYTVDIFHIVHQLIASSKSGKISLEEFMKQINNLRLPMSKIGFLDETLKSLQNLKVMVLSGNYIDHIPFKWLPPKLYFLELAGNIVDDIQITENKPKIFYLGLSYNMIHNSSEGRCTWSMNCSDVSPQYPYSKRFQQLLPPSSEFIKYTATQPTDDSLHCDNNICQMDDLLLGLGGNTSLTSLSLRGNPCSVTVGYGWKVSKGLPNLVFLDGRPLKELILDEKKHETYSEMFLNSGVLQIYVFRLMGLAKPNAKRSHFEIELEVPLLDERFKNRLTCQLKEVYFKEYHGISEENAVSKEYLSPTKESNNLFDPKGSPKQKSPTSKPPDVLKEEEAEAYKEPLMKSDHFLLKDFVSPELTQFKSESLHWNIIMKPKQQPVFEITVFPEDITDLRDTFRTIITMKIYNREVLTQKKEPTSGDITSTLVAKILIPAEIPFWNEPYKGYIWNAKEPNIAKPYPNIGDINFAVGGKGMLKSEDVKEGVFPPPANLTCHLGLSLKRNIKYTKER